VGCGARWCHRGSRGGAAGGLLDSLALALQADGVWPLGLAVLLALLVAYAVQLLFELGGLQLLGGRQRCRVVALALGSGEEAAGIGLVAHAGSDLSGALERPVIA
jgi:hypothetical protein